MIKVTEEGKCSLGVGVKGVGNIGSQAGEVRENHWAREVRDAIQYFPTPLTPTPELHFPSSITFVIEIGHNKYLF